MRNPWSCVVYVIAILGPMVGIPQAVKIWVEGETAGLSIASWVGYVVVNLVWFAHSILKRDRALFLTQCMWLIINTTILVGLLIRI